MVYIINSLGWNAFSDYRLYLYGPYSDNLYNEILNLKDEGMLEEITDDGYLYKLTDKGNKIFNLLEKRITETRLKEKTNSILKDIRNFNTDKLELISTLHYLHNFQHLDNDRLVDEIRKLKPKFKSTEIKNTLSEEIVKKIIN